jgi:N-acyl-D-aspartate/D-glutamate deacylase
MPRKEAVAKLKDRARDKIKADHEFAEYVNEHGGWEGIVGSVFTRSQNKQYEGKTILEISKLRGQSDPAETCFDLITEEGAFIPGVHHTMSEADVKYVMQIPWVSVASDGSALNLNAPGKPHPRSYGTNVRVLGKYVREEKILALEDAVRKMTSLPAQTMRLKDRGLLREGYWADVVILILVRLEIRRPTKIHSSTPRACLTCWSTEWLSSITVITPERGPGRSFTLRARIAAAAKTGDACPDGSSRITKFLWATNCCNGLAML